MVRGTTPTHTYTLPFDTSIIKVVEITYAQLDAVIVKKTTDDCTLDGNTVTVRLTQEDTLQFDHRQNVQIQLRVLTKAGDALASEIRRVSVQQCLGNEVLV